MIAADGVVRFNRTSESVMRQITQLVAWLVRDEPPRLILEEQRDLVDPVRKQKPDNVTYAAKGAAKEKRNGRENGIMRSSAFLRGDFMFN